MNVMKIFVSHSHHDTDFCHAAVAALRAAGADVWYDEHNMGVGRLGPVIERELRERQVFIVILSPAAVHSAWVEDETRWFFALYRRDTTRIILPVVAEAFAPDDLWLFLADFRQVSAPFMQPYPRGEAIARMLHALALDPTPPPVASAEQAIAQGKALLAQGRVAEAIAQFEHATQADPQSTEAWEYLNRARAAIPSSAQPTPVAPPNPNLAAAWNGKGNALVDLGHYREALASYDRALAIDPRLAAAWSGKGNALYYENQMAAALDAYQRALALDPRLVVAWNGAGAVQLRQGNLDDARGAFDHALAIDALAVDAWTGKGNAWYLAGKPAEALTAYEQALTVDRNNVDAWTGKGNVLCQLQQFPDALAAYDHALTIAAETTGALKGRGIALMHLARYDEALATLDHLLTLTPRDADAWNAKGNVLHHMGRNQDALVAFDRASELGG